MPRAVRMGGDGFCLLSAAVRIAGAVWQLLGGFCAPLVWTEAPAIWRGPSCWASSQGRSPSTPASDVQNEPCNGGCASSFLLLGPRGPREWPLWWQLRGHGAGLPPGGVLGSSPGEQEGRLAGMQDVSSLQELGQGCRMCPSCKGRSWGRDAGCGMHPPCKGQRCRMCPSYKGRGWGQRSLLGGEAQQICMCHQGPVSRWLNGCVSLSLGFEKDISKQTAKDGPGIFPVSAPRFLCPPREAQGGCAGAGAGLK